MGIDYSPRNWLQTSVEYRGEARLELVSPEGSVAGPCLAQFDDSGTAHVKLSVARWDSVVLLVGGIHQLLSGVAPTLDPAPSTAIFDQEFLYSVNNCSRLEVVCDSGNLSANQRILINNTHLAISISEGMSISLGLMLDVVEYRTASAASPKYWVIPLTNFVSDFVEHHKELDQHSLRMFPVPPLADDATAGELIAHQNYVDRHNRLIVFEYGGTPAFIEALPDYDARVAQLKNGSHRRLATAVMVGELGNNGTSLTEVQEWLPVRLLNLLGVVTGREVDAPWIEFRDESGCLVQRTHFMIKPAFYSEGHKAISEYQHQGTGKWLTNALKSPAYQENHFAVTMKFLIASFNNSLPMEDCLSLLFRALDSLCEHFELATQYLSKELNEHNREVVAEALRIARQNINAASQAAMTADQQDQSRILSTIAGRVPNVSNKDRNFGLAVCDLLARFSFPDADVIDAHFATKASDGTPEKWSRLLADRRGVTMHTGYFNVSSPAYNFNENVALQRHMQDILLRILFKLYEYDGMYQPPTIMRPVKAPIDWVSASTSASLLGYT